MYVVVVKHKVKEPLSDLIVELRNNFPKELFTIEGSEEKGFNLRVEGAGDEKAPRKFSESYLKKWKPQPEEIK